VRPTVRCSRRSKHRTQPTLPSAPPCASLRAMKRGTPHSRGRLPDGRIPSLRLPHVAASRQHAARRSMSSARRYFAPPEEICSASSGSRCPTKLVHSPTHCRRCGRPDHHAAPARCSGAHAGELSWFGWLVRRTTRWRAGVLDAVWRSRFAWIGLAVVARRAAAAEGRPAVRLVRSDRARSAVGFRRAQRWRTTTAWLYAIPGGRARLVAAGDRSSRRWRILSGVGQWARDLKQGDRPRRAGACGDGGAAVRAPVVAPSPGRKPARGLLMRRAFWAGRRIRATVVGHASRRAAASRRGCEQSQCEHDGCRRRSPLR